MPDHHAPGLSVATALLFSWSILTLAVRCWVKLGRSETWGWDDSSIAAAFAFSLFHIVCVLRAVHDGLGLSDDSLADPVRDVIEKALFAGQIFYVISVGLSKVSTGLFIAQLTRHGSQVKRAYALAGVCGVWVLACVFVIALRGDLHQPWTTVDGSHTMFIRWAVVEATGLAVETALWGLTINIIWKLSMPLAKRCTILAIFGCRLILIPLVSLRLYWLSPAKNPGNPLSSMTQLILTEVVLQFAFMSASVTCLKPFLKPFNSSYVVSTAGNSGNGWQSGANQSSNRDPYYVLSMVRGADKNGVLVSTTTKDTESEPGTRPELHTTPQSFRPDKYERETTFSASSRKGSAAAMDDRTIRKTETWSVRVEGRSHLDEDGKASTPSNPATEA